MYLLFDIGGTNMRFASSQDGQTLDKIQIFRTPHEFHHAIGTIKHIISELSQGKKIYLSAGGVRALDHTKTHLVNHPRFPLWVNKPLKHELEKITKSPVYLENDAAMAALGEAVYGAGKNYNIVSYLTISTGVGGARIVNKKIDHNFLGFEPGNQIIDIDFDTGKCIYLEDVISGAGIEQSLGMKPASIEDKEIWQQIEKILAIGLNNTIVHWSPEVIILNGPIAYKISIKSLRQYLRRMNKVFTILPEIMFAQLGDKCALYGSLAYIENYNLKPNHSFAL